MKKKGFTLIELLAVIVILAIIAVITVPKIADMISSSRQGGAEDSFYGTLKAAELGYTKALQSNTNLKGSTCTITDSKITCTNGVNINVSGKTPESGTLVIDSAGSTIAKALTLNGYKCYGDLSTSNPCVKSDVEVVSETLIKKVTTTSNGLYKDSYDGTRYVYKGENPNNYLTFNDENWRIVSVESDGTIKIIKDSGITEKMPFDSRNSDNVSGRRLNSNNSYCRLWNNIYYGCNAWSATSGTYVNNGYSGTVTEDSDTKIYLRNYYNSLSLKSKNQTQNHTFNIGSISWNVRTSVDQIIKQDQKNQWIDNIALLSISDFLKASTNTSCTGDTNPWWVTDNHNHSDYSCSNNNYLYKSDKWWWLINPSGEDTHRVLEITQYGYIFPSDASHDQMYIIPAMYLKANLQLEGNGTNSDPYKIKAS